MLFAILLESSIRLELSCSRQSSERSVIVEREREREREREIERENLNWEGRQLKLPNVPKNKAT